MVRSVGGGGYHGSSKDRTELGELNISGMSGVVPEQNLLQLAIKGIYNIHNNNFHMYNYLM